MSTPDQKRRVELISDVLFRNDEDFENFLKMIAQSDGFESAKQSFLEDPVIINYVETMLISHCPALIYVDVDELIQGAMDTISHSGKKAA